MLFTHTKNYCFYPILNNGISSFCHSYNNNAGRPQQQYLSGSSFLTDPNYLQGQESRLDTIKETETKEQPQPPFIKRILLVDDDPDITLTFKAGLDGYNYGDGDKKKRFEVYTYNDPLLLLEEFKPNFYDLLLTDIYMPNMNGFQLYEKILGLDINFRVCFMSALEVNAEALREIYPKVSFGCFIEKPITIEYLVKRLSAELD
jgi:CheY-like chemotaxis protein